MPRRDDIKRIMLVGSGPIVIGQAAEFDYSGTQACKVLMEEGYEVILVNSNPATIMTDPEFATATYIEPLLPGPVAQIIAKERPDALLPTLGGGTALNLARVLHDNGTLERYGVELIGADYEAIDRAEDRDRFRETMASVGLRVPRSAIATDLAGAEAALIEIGLPIIIRPAFTLGGHGGGIARTAEEFRATAARGIAASPIGQILIDESVLGWGEFELEVMRDRADNVVVICSIENLDPMGVHTGDSVCVAPQQTLTDKLYQRLRDQAITVMRAVGVETGGSNVQFAVNPVTEEIIVIEMNPRVSRSSALASKATGFPIAKIAARLAVGYTLEEIDNDITMRTPASFEPTIDYTVVKWPRFAFEKCGSVDDLIARAAQPGADRFDLILEALRQGAEIEAVHKATGVDRWFVAELQRLATDPESVHSGQRTFKSVDTCAAEFEAETPYYYSSWDQPGPAGLAGEVRRGDRPSIVILGSGPNRIGQGIEFDYCCVHAAMCVRDSGRDAVMINCNPETVSTDYDTSDRLYFEPLTLEAVMAVIEVEAPEGVIVQFGGQTPLRLAAGLEAAGAVLLGTSVDAIDLAEDRGRFGALLGRLGYRAPAFATASSVQEALAAAPGVGFPLLVRPSYVLGGRAMEIVYDEAGLRDYLDRTGQADAVGGRERFLDRFLENAVEVDVDALCDGKDVWIGGIMQHVEEAGIHSGDSACVLPPHSLGTQMLAQIREHTEGIALALGVVGLMNVQYAAVGGELYVIEANPRASRTVPFVSKATGIPLAKMACRIMLGESIASLNLPLEPSSGYVSVKEAVMPFDRFAGAESLLGPEMRSTGEVMGIAADFPTAFAKAQAAAGAQLPDSGTVFITVTDSDKPGALAIASQLSDLGFRIVATRGTAQSIARMGVPVEELNKIGEGSPHVVDWIERGDALQKPPQSRPL
ncbi:MAG: carbamoyl-phosphate synthase large subunit [Solirubrobacterales bacterium]|nr:carbamoyl-phosphate synthase large subunit [Solirubrobacterales bacterium]